MFIHPRRRRGGGNVGIAAAISKVWERVGKQLHRFLSLSTDRHFHGLLHLPLHSGRDLRRGALPVLLKLHWADVVQRRVHACLVIQLGFKTPIKPTSEKYSISGIRGMDSGYVFTAKWAGAELRPFVACERNRRTRPPWRYRNGCSTLVCAAGRSFGVRHG